MKTELVANHQNSESNVKPHNEDHQSVASNVDGLLREISGATVETLAMARTKIEEKLDEAKSGIKATRISISGKAHGAADSVYGYVAGNPWKVVGVATAAAVAGVIVGIILNRR